MSEIILTREELYERVWHCPMRDVARELSVSDVGLAKLCNRNGIPKPPQGFHLRKPGIAKDRLIKSLPPREAGQHESFHFSARKDKTLHLNQNQDSKLNMLPDKEPTLNTKQSREIKSILKTIKCQIHLKKVDERGILKVPDIRFPIRVAPASYARAEDLLNTLFRQLVLMGAIVNPFEISKASERLTVNWEEYDFHFRIEEFSTRQKIPPEKRRKTNYYMPSDDWILVPTNKLTLEVNGPGYGLITLRDGRRLIEDRLDGLINKMFERTVSENERERVRAERMQRAVAYLEEKDRHEREVEFQSLRKKKLIYEFRQWQRAESLREYIGVIESVVYQDNPLSFSSYEDKQAWVQWAYEYLATLCPIESGSAGKMPSYPAPTEITGVPSYFLEFDDPVEAEENKGRYWW